MHVLLTEGAGAADDCTRGNEHERSQGAKKADAHVSARIAPGRGSSTGQTAACAPGSRQAVLQRAALRGAAPPAADASRSRLAGSPCHPPLSDAGTAGRLLPAATPGGVYREWP